MKELENTKSEIDIVSQVKKQQEKEYKFLGRLVPHNGHFCWEFNRKTGEIRKADFVQEAAQYSAAKNGQISYIKKVMVKENCLYVMALNEKNAEKKFAKMLFGSY